MRFCINEASTMPTDFATDVQAYAAAGFQGIELWLDKVDTYLRTNSLEDGIQLLRDNGLEATAACAQGNLLVSQGEAREKALDNLKHKLGLCQALGAPVLIVASESPKEVALEDYDRAVDSLRQVADIAQPYGVKIALEFIRGSTLIGSVASAIHLINRANHPNVGLLFDTFHYWAGVSKPGDIQSIPMGQVAFIHVNDCLDIPRERLGDQHRTYMGRGPIPTRQLVEALQGRGYDGWLSFEIFNRAVWEEDPFQVAAKIRRNMEEVLG